MPTIGNMPYLQLINQLERMHYELENQEPCLKVNSNIDTFWYMQKITELKELRSRFEEAMDRVVEVRKMMDAQYFSTRSRYKAEQRWFKRKRKCSPRVKKTKAIISVL